MRKRWRACSYKPLSRSVGSSLDNAFVSTPPFNIFFLAQHRKASILLLVQFSLPPQHTLARAVFSSRVTLYMTRAPRAVLYGEGDLEGALEVDAAITAAKIEITESEYGAILSAFRTAERWDDGFSLLRRLREDIRTLGDAMADEVRLFMDGAPGWTTEASVRVDEASGACEAQPSGKRMQLSAVNLSTKDRADLLAGIGKLAREREAGGKRGEGGPCTTSKHLTHSIHYFWGGGWEAVIRLDLARLPSAMRMCKLKKTHAVKCVRVCVHV